jgi:hypothetical protein
MTPRNLLLEEVEYRIDETSFGTWRRFVYPTGAYFAEFKSRRTFGGMPLVHFTRGICPETGKRIVARGVVAVGRLAVGGLAIGQASLGVVAIGQLALGIWLGLGQASTGLFALGQLAFGAFFAVGQVAIGLTSIGQFGVGRHVLAQIGFGDHVWSMRRADPEAVEYFKQLLQSLRQALPFA